MKALAVLFAGKLTGNSREPLAGGASAFERSVARVSEFPHIEKVLVCAAQKGSGCIENSHQYILRKKDEWTPESFFSVIEEESEGFDHIYLVWADCPFLDSSFAAKLYDLHVQYASEYTFADGYPLGLAPEILARGILPVLVKMTQGISTPLTRESVFETIKKEINSFDIETDIAPVDLRHLRLEFACDTKRNTLLCESFTDITIQNYANLIAERAEALRSLPAFYALQIAGRCPYECRFCPYPEFCLSGQGISPGISASNRRDFMKYEDFSLVIDKISRFSGDAVVSLSLWGEPSYHPDIVLFIKKILSYPSLSVLIETTGISWDPLILTEIAESLKEFEPRQNGQPPITWIVSLDAVGSTCYGNEHGIEEGPQADVLFREALATVEVLLSLFPKAVHPQMLRLKTNEEELESFYRFWKQKTGNVIIQKHDHFCSSITDLRVADLSPLIHHPCWHLKRDMCIMMDGTVPLCREDLYATHLLGNAFSQDFEKIWSESIEVYQQHVKCNYEGLCGACDEYYTYNF